MVFPLMARAVSAWPNASTTGIPVGTSLSTNSGDFTTTSNGQIVDALDVTGGGMIIVAHNNVTVKRCRVPAIYMETGTTALTVEDCELNGDAAIWNTAVGLKTDSSCRRCNIYGTENGILVSGGGNNVVIEDNYIHDLAAGVGAHIDGIQLFADHDNILVDGNNIDLESSDASSCFTMTDTTNLTISNNRMRGGGYCIYLEETGAGLSTGISLLNNRLGVPVFGYTSTDAGVVADVTRSGNVDDDTGVNID